jgi:hypothetical protein
MPPITYRSVMTTLKSSTAKRVRSMLWRRFCCVASPVPATCSAI